MSGSVIEFTRRRLHLVDAPRPIDDLRRSPSDAMATGLPRAFEEGIRSFYDELHASPTECDGTACAHAKGWLRQSGVGAHGEGVHCLGRCYEAPASARTAAGAIPRRSLVTPPMVLRHLTGASDPFADYDLPDGATILARVDAAKLRGRGGAAYPTAAKWRAARDTPAVDRVVVANGDEGDPGSFVDRLLLEEAPHSVLAGMLACARAIGARRGIVFIRGEYPEAAKRVEHAIREAEARALLGDFRLEVKVGAGSYVAGEETALLRSIEGLRAEPSPKPPYPAQRGLDGLPTVVQNIETLSVVPLLARGDFERRSDRAIGVTKAICVSGAVASPGVVEIALGTSLRRVLEEGAGGSRADHPWTMALVGGPMGRVVAASEFDVALSYEALSGMGHGGIVVLDERTQPRALAEHLFAFASGESCGSCTPCRVGTRRLAQAGSLEELERLMTTLEIGSMCGFGQGVPRPLRDLVRLFGAEVIR